MLCHIAHIFTFLYTYRSMYNVCLPCNMFYCFPISPQDYLSSLGVLHWDLACRNILVDERRLLKISDTPEYMSSLKDKMPLRWMAPETVHVTEKIFTDKSDV